MLGWIGCGGASGTATVNGTDPASIRSAPAGVATLAFTDIETLTPAMVAGTSPLPTGITTSTPSAGTTRYTYTNVTAANTGKMSGYVDVTYSGNTYTLDYHLAVPSSTIQTASGVHALAAAVTGWTYTGTAQFLLGTNSANLSVLAPGITAAYTDTTTAANDKSYSFTADLTAQWSGTGSSTTASLYGLYSFTPSTGEAISVTIKQATPLVWTSACNFPESGTLTLDLMTGSTVTETATAVFSSTCGQITLDGATLTLGN
jgi:hypothetical protein